MSPPTNGAASLPLPPMTGLSDAALFPFDSFSADDFFATAPPPLGADPRHLLLAPSRDDVHASRDLAVAAPVETTGSPSALAPLPLTPSSGQRTSCYRGVTRYT